MSPIRHSSDPAEVCAVLAAGGIVILPTDTLPGIHARLDRPGALARLRALKGRDDGKPLLVLAASIKVAVAWTVLDPTLTREAECVWPGPFTLVLPAAANVPAAVTCGGTTLAVRVPGTADLRDLLAAVGSPLVSTSVNAAGEPPARNLNDAAARFGELVDLVADLGWQGGQAPSTLADLTVRPPRILRTGAGTPPESWQSVSDEYSKD